MTKRRWLVVAGLLACLVCIPLVVLVILPYNRPGVTEANFARIRNGMTLKEVEDIFGERGCDLPAFSKAKPVVGKDFLFWESESGVRVYVAFSKDQVTAKEWVPLTETVLKKIRRWLYL